MPATVAWVNFPSEAINIARGTIRETRCFPYPSIPCRLLIGPKEDWGIVHVYGEGRGGREIWLARSLL